MLKMMVVETEVHVINVVLKTNSLPHHTQVGAEETR